MTMLPLPSRPAADMRAILVPEGPALASPNDTFSSNQCDTRPVAPGLHDRHCLQSALTCQQMPPFARGSSTLARAEGAPYAPSPRAHLDFLHAFCFHTTPSLFRHHEVDPGNPVC